MAEMIPVDASLPPCPMDVALQEDDTFVFVETRHPNKLLEGLNSLRLSNTFCDVILCCGGQEFPCHRNVLASFSPYFQAMFTTEWTESQQNKIVINGVEPQMIDLLVCYAYTSKVAISTENVQALLAASDLLNVSAVKEACCHYVERHMEDFLSLGVDKLTEILASDDINVPNEEMVFKAAMLWLEKCSTRRQSFEKVLDQIRLPHISPSFLHDVIESLDVVKESQGCRRLISEAKNQDLLPYSHRAQPRWSTVYEVMVMVGIESVEKDIENDVFLRLESFDPRTNQWRTLERLPFTVENFGLVVSGSDLYLAGGEPYAGAGTSFRDLWRYDRSRDLWLEMAPMIEARCDLGLVMLDGYVYAVRGMGDRHVASVERYDPNTNTWQLMKPVGIPIRDSVSYPAVVALDGLIYVIGGTTDSGQVYTYSPQTSVWKQGAPTQIPRLESGACVLKGKIYIIGGRHEWEIEESTDQVECYNPETDQWTMCASMNEQRTSPGVAVVDGRIYVLDGLLESSRTIERYCEEADTWEIVWEMPTAPVGVRCVSFKLRMDAHTANESATADNHTYELRGR